jgi:hypothetical protein
MAPKGQPAAVAAVEPQHHGMGPVQGQDGNRQGISRVLEAPAGRPPGDGFVAGDTGRRAGGGPPGPQGVGMDPAVLRVGPLGGGCDSGRWLGWRRVLGGGLWFPRHRFADLGAFGHAFFL